MTELNRRLKRSQTGAEESGFTLIELLIVIVVLGILAAIVVFALSGVTGKSTTAACQSDAKTVGIAVAALQAENPTSWATYTSSNWQTELLLNSTATGGLTGGPFLQSWPTGNSAYYKIEVAGNTPPAINGTTTATAEPTASNGDVIVIPKTGSNAGKTFDATLNPVTACKHLS